LAERERFTGLGHHPEGSVPRAMLTLFPRACAAKMGEGGQRSGVPSRNGRSGTANPNKKNKPQKPKAER
jgi:hypothetical protein